ncbi:LysE family translocator [Fictibacillus nanhaiensis]|uniref:LysE family transporter n=1 Tax=Fictibacillus nanhaiensis TaxID=742169 RepID=UPI001C96E8AE|nr:LysE family transporter [Fictibacillus nanhaiensis]MBY6036530.1 LysE family translocator [Fictibacillus nanhaiensis]
MIDYWVMSFHFIMLGISLAAPVGPIKLEMIKKGVHGGFWPSWLVGLGAASADLIFMASIFLGLSPFLRIHVVQIGMLLIGIGMLTTLGISSIKEAITSKITLHLDGNQSTSKAPYWTGFLLALMNPFNFVFWFGVYGGALQAIPPHYGEITAIQFSLFIIAGIVLWNVNIAFTVHYFRTLINEYVIRWITGLAGLGLVGFAIHLTAKLIRSVLSM